MVDIPEYHYKEELRNMKQTKITYEAFGDTLLIHMPKELDHHNCRDLKRDTDLMLDENYINRIMEKRNLWILPGSESY